MIYNSRPLNINACQSSNYRIHFPKTILFVILFIQLIWIKPIFSQQQKADSLLEVLKGTNTDTSRVNVLYYLSDVFWNNDPEKAIEYANSGLELATKIDFKNGMSICLNALGFAYYQLGKFDTALINFERRYEIALALNDSNGIASACDNIAIIYMHFGEKDKALDLRLRANDIYAALNNNSSLANGFSWIGNIYQEHGDYSSALDYYFKAVKIYEVENEEQNIGYPYLNISSVYRYLKQYDKAIGYTLAAKQKFEKTNSPDGVGASLYRLSIVYFEMKNYDKTIECLNEAKLNFEGTRNIYGLTTVNTLLGSCYYEKGNNETAYKYFNISQINAVQIGDLNLTATIYQNLGAIQNDEGHYLAALDYMIKSKKLLTELKDRKALLEIYPYFIEIYSRLNETDSVIDYFKKFRQLSDTIFNEQNKKTIAEVQTKYETEKKEVEILALKLENDNKYRLILRGIMVFISLLVIALLSFLNFRNKKKREQANLNLQAIELRKQLSENNMKALLSQMNPHFIFNCVQTIERLIDDSKIEESKECLVRFSMLTRTVLENSTKSEIPIEEELETLCNYMLLENLRFTNQFTFNINIAPDIDPKTSFIPPLILQPFVENSIKHGFHETDKSGHIEIEIQKKDDLLICIIEDNGVGRKKNMTSKALSGFKKESYGMKIVEERLRLISLTKNDRSRLIVDDLLDKEQNAAGTRITLYLPYTTSV
jgi:tetratricopeptide (TPR) repeat protein